MNTYTRTHIFLINLLANQAAFDHAVSLCANPFQRYVDISSMTHTRVMSLARYVRIELPRGSVDLVIELVLRWVPDAKHDMHTYIKYIKYESLDESKSEFEG